LQLAVVGKKVKSRTLAELEAGKELVTLPTLAAHVTVVNTVEPAGKAPAAAAHATGVQVEPGVVTFTR